VSVDGGEEIKREGNQLRGNPGRESWGKTGLEAVDKERESEPAAKQSESSVGDCHERVNPLHKATILAELTETPREGTREYLISVSQGCDDGDVLEELHEQIHRKGRHRQNDDVRPERTTQAQKDFTSPGVSLSSLSQECDSPGITDSIDAMHNTGGHYYEERDRGNMRRRGHGSTDRENTGSRGKFAGSGSLSNSTILARSRSHHSSPSI
jgi:hypothetical protein